MFKKLIKFLLVVVVLCGIASQVSAADPRYVLALSTPNMSYYIDTQSMYTTTEGSKEYVDVWVKEVPNGQGLNNIIIPFVKSYGRSSWGYDKFDYRLTNMHVSIKTPEVRMVRFVDYNTSGNLLNEVPMNSGWFRVTPGRTIEQVANSILAQSRQ